MNEDQNNDGLREQIARAETPEEVTNLLAKAGTFTQASERTRRAWQNTAKRRLGELTARQGTPFEQPKEDRGALDQADKEARMLKTAMHGLRYSTPNISLGGVK